jgi:hypothetical protein
MRRQIACLALAAGLMTGAAACEDLPGGGEDQQSPAPQTPPPGSTGGPDGTTTPGPPPPPGGVLASGEFQAVGAELRVDITSMRRQGQSLLLVWTVTHLGGEAWNPFVTIGSDVSGTTLVDPVNGQRYLVARTGGADGPCVCSTIGIDNIYPGDSSEYNATFSSPPPDVTQVNVDFPELGLIPDVPVS